MVQWCSGAVVQWCNGARAMAQWRRGAVGQMLRCCGGFEQVLSFSRGDCFLCRCAEVQWYHNGTEVHRFTGSQVQVQVQVQVWQVGVQVKR